MPQSVTPRQAALWFASQGFPTLPLHSVTENGTCTCGNGTCASVAKHPIADLAPHGVKSATLDSDAIRAWPYWANYGIDTTKVIVIDVDVKHGGVDRWQDMCRQPTRHLPCTWETRTGSNGRHVWFKNTANVRCGSLDAGIDVRAAGGYVCGPACRHASGRTYKWLPQSSPAEVPLADPPDWLVSLIKTRSHCGRAVSVEGWRKIAGTRVEDGERHRTFLKIAGHLIANPLNDPIMVRELMLGWNRGMCDPPLTDKDVLQMIENLVERELAKQRWL
jgi:hypothetical protein